MAKMFFSKRLVALFWLASLITIAVMVHVGSAAWDTDVYWAAIKSLHMGGDPYAEGIAVQEAFHRQGITDPHIHPPMTYVYSPITLPILRLIGGAPGWLVGAVYYSAIVIGFLLQLWAGWRMAETNERRWLIFLLPAAVFFPGLLNDDVLLSGNIAYLVYGLVLAAAVPGWERNRWGWYYLAVLAASCCKAPLLTLLAIPAFIARRQWYAVGTMGATGCLLFYAQARLWPRLFSEYLRAVGLQFEWNHDFGFGPAGILGHALTEAGWPYSSLTTILYLVFAALVCSILFWTSRQVQGIRYAREAWLPVVLVGAILLNPRIKEYDVAPLTIPLVLIASRSMKLAMKIVAEFQNRRSPHLVHNPVHGDRRRAPDNRLIEPKDLPFVFAVLGWFLAINFAAASDAWKLVELALLICLFAAGAWEAIYRVREMEQLIPCRISGFDEIERTLGIELDKMSIRLQ